MTLALFLAWTGTLCWGVCFWWMHRLSSRQEMMLKELHDVTARIEKLSKAEHDLIRDVLDLVPAYTTIGIFYDPAQTEAFDEFRASIERALQALEPARPRAGEEMVIEVPVCYEDEFAPDLDEVARHAGLSPEEIVRRHAQASYRVTCVGFTPGCPYLSGLPPELATP